MRNTSRKPAGDRQLFRSQQRSLGKRVLFYLIADLVLPLPAA